MTLDLPLVPPGRLGSLLETQRLAAGLTLHELAERSAEFSPARLLAVESGDTVVDDAAIARLVQLYRLPPGEMVAERAELTIDLRRGALAVGGQLDQLDPGAGIDDVLARYLSLLYLLRGVGGGRLPLRQTDLGVLSLSLESSIEAVERQLFELMLGGQAVGLAERLKGRLAIPAAGLLVGLTAVGSLVLAPLPTGSRPRLVGAPSTAAQPGAAAQGALAPDAALGPAPTALPTTVIDGVGAPVAVSVGGGAVSQPYQPGEPASVGAAAERYLRIDWREALPGWRVRYAGERAGYRGTTDTAARLVTIHVGPDDTPYEVAEVLAHELAHGLDVEYLDDVARGRWLVQRDITTPWWPESGAADFAVGAGDFAEAVAALLVGSPSDSTHGGFSEADLALVAELLDL